MTTWHKVQGDVNDTIIPILSGVETLATVSAIEGHVWRRGVSIVLAAAVTDPVARTVTVQLGGAAGWLATAEAGDWSTEVQGTFADGSVFTWPSGEPDKIVVRADA